MDNFIESSKIKDFEEWILNAVSVYEKYPRILFSLFKESLKKLTKVTYRVV